MAGSPERNPNFVPVGFTPEIVGAEGCYLIARDGQRILDAAGGAIVANIGHGRRPVREAMMRSLERLDYVVPHFPTPERIQLVERLKKDWLPGRLSRVFFTSGGSEAVDAALRLVRVHHALKGAPERTKIIGRDISYHGTTMATLEVGGHDGRRKPFLSVFHDAPKAPTPYPLRRRDLDCAAALEEIILKEGPETVAAFIAEPISGASGGAIVPPADYWPKVQEICRKYGLLLIIDEVMVGFGRVGSRFALEQFNIDADIMIAGKGLAAGYAPLVGLFATEEVVAPLTAAGESLMFYTYGGSSSACAAADAVLAIMDQERLIERSARMGELLGARLQRLAQHPHVAEVRGRGLFHAVELVADRDTLARFPLEAKLTQKIVTAGLEEGVFVYPAGNGTVRDVILLGPPFTVTEDEIETICSVLERAIDRSVAGV